MTRLHLLQFFKLLLRTVLQLLLELKDLLDLVEDSFVALSLAQVGADLLTEGLFDIDKRLNIVDALLFTRGLQHLRQLVLDGDDLLDDFVMQSASSRIRRGHADGFSGGGDRL
jgi:hypothetical protein